MTITSFPSQRRVLVCDDSDSERRTVARFLELDGHVVDQAPDGAAAIAALKDGDVDLVILDLNMPEVDGFGVLNYLREHRRSLPIILLSGMPPNHIQHGIRGLKSHELPPLLLKPIDPDQLAAMVELALSGQLKDVCRGES